MRKTAAIGYGLAAYMIFRATFLYHIGFVAGIVVPKGIDDGAATPTGAAIAVDLTLVALRSGS